MTGWGSRGRVLHTNFGLCLARALADGKNKGTVLVWGSDKEPEEGTRLKLG
jgi:hypothetical protein